MSEVAEAILRRHRTVTIGSLATLALIAWAWIASGAGMGMAAHGMAGHAMAMDWTASRVALTLAMWWVMMIAMMIPAAAPVVLLYGRAALAHDIEPRSGPFVLGYLLAWLGFSILAVALQAALERSGLLASMEMAVTSRWLAGGALVAAGAYQLSPAKEACLAHCRNPADFLWRHFRPGAAGAMRMGLIHGAYCVGCCWMLMVLLFVVGVMNLAWIALLTLMVAGEKLLPRGPLLARIGGALLILWGATILLLG